VQFDFASSVFPHSFSGYKTAQYLGEARLFLLLLKKQGHGGSHTGPQDPCEWTLETVMGWVTTLGEPAFVHIFSSIRTSYFCQDFIHIDRHRATVAPHSLADSKSSSRRWLPLGHTQVLNYSKVKSPELPEVWNPAQTKSMEPWNIKNREKWITTKL